MKKGHLIILSGPSGVGKGTIKDAILNDPSFDLHFSVSCTTRQPRENEVHGVHYYFVTHERFDEMIEEDAFLEYAKFVENSYGTPAKPVDENLDQGRNVLLEIEMKGALQVIEKRPDVESIYILPPSLEELEKRLRARETETEEQIQKRLTQAKEDLTYVHHYKYQVVNDDLEKAVEDVKNIIRHL